MPTKSVQEVLQDKFGVAVRVNSALPITQANIAVQELFRNDPTRLAFVIVNLSVNVIFAAPRANVSSTNGLRIAASGGSLVVSIEEDFTLQTLPWFITSDVDASAIFAIEILIEPQPSAPA